MTARNDLLQLFADWGVNSGKGARERADRILAKHQAEVLLRAAAALEVNARQGDQDGLTRIYKRAAVDFLRGMAALAEAADRPDAPAEDECRCCGKDTAACLCEPDADGTCICAQAPATWRQRTPAEFVRYAQSGVASPGCNCGHDGMGEAWHTRDCAWRRLDDRPTDASGVDLWHVEQCVNAETGDCPCIVAADQPGEFGTRYIADAETPELAALIVAEHNSAQHPAGGVVHACPPLGSGVTPCCGRTPLELLGDRIAAEPAEATCAARPADEGPVDPGACPHVNLGAPPCDACSADELPQDPCGNTHNDYGPCDRPTGHPEIYHRNLARRQRWLDGPTVDRLDAASATRPADGTQQQEQPVGVAQAKLLAEAATRAHDGTRPADDTATYEVWPLTRVLAEVRCGSDDWPWEDEWADLDRHHAEQLTLLEHEIAQHGIKDPVVIGSDGRLWDGHHRLRVAVRLGIEWVPVEITPSDDTQQQETQ